MYVEKKNSPKQILGKTQGLDQSAQRAGQGD